MRDVYITKHAEKRLRKRCGCNKKAAKRNFELAKKNGLRRKDVSGRIGKYLDKIFIEHKNSNLILYNGFVYACKKDSSTGEDLLVTVYPMPKNIVVLYKRLCEKKKGSV